MQLGPWVCQLEATADMFPAPFEWYLGGQSTVLGMVRQRIDLDMACIENMWVSLHHLRTSFTSHPLTLLNILLVFLPLISQRILALGSLIYITEISRFARLSLGFQTFTDLLVACAVFEPTGG